MAGLGGLSKLGKMQDAMKNGMPDEHKGKEKPMPKGKVEGESDESGVKTHTIEEHPDGHFETHMHDGTAMEHPDHLHMMAHLGHHLSGGDKHHVAHHDGMGVTTHGIHESGEHEGPMEHNSAEEAKEAFGNFMDEEAKEPQHQGSEPEMAYGGME